MKLGILFSGGKDSMLATFIAKKMNYEIKCLLTIESMNKESYMFHTPSISKVKYQAKVMNLPLLIKKTKGEKEKELNDLRSLIKEAKIKYKIDGIVTGAVLSVYQSTRIQKICNELNLELFNPLWQKNQEEILIDLIKNKFDVIIVGVFAYPLDEKWIGKKINYNFIKEIKRIKKWDVNLAGEGGEFETFVLNCPLFNRKLSVINFKDIHEGKNSIRREINVK